MAAYRPANGQPFPLEDTNGEQVYVQPAAIAFWRKTPTWGAGQF